MSSSSRSAVTLDVMHRPLTTNAPLHVRKRTQQLREAILLTFCTPPPERCTRLDNLSDKEWQPLLQWLDTSGLALYFLDRITALRQRHILPASVLSRLGQNLTDSTTRIDAMIAESTAIHKSFQQAGLSYATLKGFSLWPISVPKLELRSQLDLDFLVADNSSIEARKILETRGYRLHAISGRSWEFKANQSAAYTLKDLYKPTPQRSVELHIETASESKASLLARTEHLCFHGVCTPVLSPVDLFLGQGLHLYKHLCSEFSRTAHIIEFRRHIIARYKQDEFWEDLRKLVGGNTRAAAALGFVTLLITRVMGDFAPEAFTSWTISELPAAARQWIGLYGSRTVFASFPGSKLYLLLQTGMQEAGLPAKRPLRYALLPRGLPPAIAHGAPGETLPARIQRYRRQVHFVLFRLQFHILEGLRYLFESARWRRYMKQFEQ
jgi:hypothetical protein